MKLPIPDNNALEHSRKVKQYIADKIQQAGGGIPFTEYMEHALYAPGLGYYSAGCIKFGESGDFITAPEISSLFSHCIAHAVSPVLKETELATVLEVGAGSGKMVADFLNEISNLEIDLKHYYILERSAELRERQQHTIKKIAPENFEKVEWLDSLPTKFSGVIVANELLDAMPVHRFKKNTNSISEMYVAFHENEFIWQQVEMSNSRLKSRVDSIEKNLDREFSDGYQSEVNLSAEDWLSSINDILDKGYILLIDYGYSEKEYYHEQRTQGTLNCFYQHTFHDNPFIYSGLQDITAHVDFSNLTAAVVNVENNKGIDSMDGLQLNGYTTQSQFLMASGIMELVQNSSQNNVRQQLVISQQIKKLTMPYEMGEIVKVIGFEKGLNEKVLNTLSLFSLRDLRYQL